MPTDVDLLQRYIDEHSESAFAELVRRHVNLVYAAALRRTGGRHALAEEITQKVFISLARKAAYLTSHPALTGWLYRSTRNVAIDTIRAEQRREKLAHTLTAMPDASLLADSPAEWEQLRPVIDEVMDELKEEDREIMLLRFFQGLTFAEVGVRLNLPENTARMRTTRALEKLRVRLAKRGISSTAALAGLLTSQSLVAAPASVAASATTSALAIAPAGTLATLLPQLLMNKIIILPVSAAVAALITSAAWAAIANPTSDSELAALRTENARLTQAAALDKNPGQAVAVLQAVGKRLEEKSASSASKYHNQGQATVRDAFMTYAWALDVGDPENLGKVLTYDAVGTGIIRANYDRMPAEIRTKYASPEALMSYLLVANALLTPPPGIDLAEKFVEADNGPGRAAMRVPGATQGGMDWIQTPTGWKCVLPNDYINYVIPRVLGNEMLAKLGMN